MKLVVVGFGQCGGKVADEFSRLNNEALFHRRIEIITDVFAVNTDVADLDSLSSIKSDPRHRILIGNRKTGSHGVGKINEVGAELAQKDGDKVIDAVRSSRHFYEADAFLLIAGAAGGTGSGSMPIMVKTIKNRFKDKPVYALVVLPFEHEEKIDARTVYNSATCLKSTNQVADAIFLVDNQRYIEKDSSLANNMVAINQLIAEPFFDLLRAGEEKKFKHIGIRLLDAGDIIQTLGGWTVLGYGKSQLPKLRLPFDWRRNYRKISTETHKGLQAMEEAIGDYLKELAPKAIIRYGDYPRGGSDLKITVVLSKLNRVGKIRDYYDSIPELLEDNKLRHIENESNLQELMGASTVVPSLFHDNGD
jgi:cell division GTPase FtsZ